MWTEAFVPSIFSDTMISRKNRGVFGIGTNSVVIADALIA